MSWLENRYKNKLEAWCKFEPKLQLADIILVHTKGSFIGWSIRKLTRSYWDHVALVFAIPNPKLQFYNYLVIEANRKGLEVHRIQEYLKNFRHYDIGVKRVPGMDLATRERVLAFMLNQVDQPYDLPRILGFVLRSFDLDVLKNFSNLFVDKNDFICSSFTQKAFYEAFPENRKQDVVFREGIFKRKKTKEAFVELLNYVSPGDIGKSDKAKWLYNERR
ncbi:MAG TPA: YiiX/YebB-like N1pC/P60 family cysteine hydrolase [bacterium]|nr:YiiX/YebB-like N1pC/P60 family cysteine hydrolase [bacterium]